MERLRLLVPDLDMSLCTSGIRDENRDCNRACDILPCELIQYRMNRVFSIERKFVMFCYSIFKLRRYDMADLQIIYIEYI